MTTTADPAARLAAHDARFQVPCLDYWHKGKDQYERTWEEPYPLTCNCCSGLGYLPLSGPALLAACLEEMPEEIMLALHRGLGNDYGLWVAKLRDGLKRHTHEATGPTPEAAVAAALCKAWGLDK